MAYPLAYESITVEVEPGVHDSAWSHLASGCCLRLVRHIQIRLVGIDNSKLVRDGNIITGTLIAAVRRNQLYSFRYVLGPVSVKFLTFRQSDCFGT